MCVVLDGAQAKLGYIVVISFGGEGGSFSSLEIVYGVCNTPENSVLWLELL